MQEEYQRESLIRDRTELEKEIELVRNIIKWILFVKKQTFQYEVIRFL